MYPKYFPIDWIKCQVNLPPEHFLDNPHLTFTPVIKDGDQLKYSYLDYENIKIKVYPSGWIELSGSLHKLANKGKHNWNDFTPLMFGDAINKLFTLYAVQPDDLRILQLEFGVNIRPPVKTKLVLEYLLEHKGKDFEQKISNDRGKYYQSDHSTYFLKIYDKGLQYQRPSDILRVEIKVRNWSSWRSKGIGTLHDFIMADKKPFLDQLVQRWNEVTLYDPTNDPANQFRKYDNINFWRAIREKSSTTYNKHKRRLKSLNAESGTNVQYLISEAIQSKVMALNDKINQKFGKKYCKVTGMDITSQREDSFLLSHTGLKNILVTHYQLFFKLKDRYLKDRWRHATTNKQIKEIAHQIRSQYTRKQHQYNSPQLFEPSMIWSLQTGQGV